MKRIGGVFAALLLVSSHYLMALNRVAYNNTHPLVYSTLAVLLLVLAGKTQRPMLVYGCGVATGLCLYT